MRSKNTLKYSKYYLLLEECIKYYNDYKDKMKQTEINRLMNKISLILHDFLGTSLVLTYIYNYIQLKSIDNYINNNYIIL
jgi:hypothetical protein